MCHVNVARGYRGGERQTELLIRGLARLGLRQRLIARRGEPLARRLDDLPEIDVRETGGLALSVARHAYGASLLHVHEGRSVHAANLCRFLFGISYVITRRVDNALRKNPATRRAYRNAAAIVALSRAIGDKVRDLDPSLACRVIPDASSALPRSEAIVRQIRARYEGKTLVGHIGALDHSHKGQRTLFEAAAALERTHPHLHFLLLGEGRDEASFRAAAERLENVELLGFVDNVGDYLAAFDIFVFPSLHEGLGSVLLDAMEFRLPIVATRVGGIPDIVSDGVNGLLVPPGNADKLRVALEQLADNGELRRQMGAAGFARAAEHSPDRITERYLELYRSLDVAGFAEPEA